MTKQLIAIEFKEEFDLQTAAIIYEYFYESIPTDDYCVIGYYLPFCKIKTTEQEEDKPIIFLHPNLNITQEETLEMLRKNEII